MKWKVLLTAFLVLSAFIRRKWVPIALLSIVIPMGLLAAFRLTEVLHEQPAPEIITVEAVSWNMSRTPSGWPSTYTKINKMVENHYDDSTASVDLGVHVIDYHENEGLFPSWGDDYVKLHTVATANVSGGFVYSIVIRFSKTDANALLYIAMGSVSLYNTDIKRIIEPATNELEAYAEATALNQPKDSSLEMLGWWVFHDENNSNHWITVSAEVIYFNGTAYKKVVLPIHLKVLTS